jgi:hypothetical protein
MATGEDPERYGVIAIATGLSPTLIGLRALLVAVRIGVGPFRVIVRVRWPRTKSLGMAEQARGLLDELEACPPAHETTEHATATAPRPTGDR